MLASFKAVSLIALGVTFRLIDHESMAVGRRKLQLSDGPHMA